MSNANGLEPVHGPKITVGKWLLATAGWSFLAVVVGSQYRIGEGKPELAEWGLILWQLTSSIYIPFAILWGSQYKIDIWKRSTKHETYTWAGTVSKWAARAAFFLMAFWFTWIALGATHGDFGPNGQWVPEPNHLLSSRASFFCTFESVVVLVSLSSGLFAEPAGTGTRKRQSG